MPGYERALRAKSVQSVAEQGLNVALPRRLLHSKHARGAVSFNLCQCLFSSVKIKLSLKGRQWRILSAVRMEIGSVFLDDIFASKNNLEK